MDFNVLPTAQGHPKEQWNPHRTHPLKRFCSGQSDLQLSPFTTLCVWLKFLIVQCFLLILCSVLGLEAEMFLTYPSLCLGTGSWYVRHFLLILHSFLALEAGVLGVSYLSFAPSWDWKLVCETFLTYPSLLLGTRSWCARRFLLILGSLWVWKLVCKTFLTYPWLPLGLEAGAPDTLYEEY